MRLRAARGGRAKVARASCCRRSERVTHASEVKSLPTCTWRLHLHLHFALSLALIACCPRFRLHLRFALALPPCTCGAGVVDVPALARPCSNSAGWLHLQELGARAAAAAAHTTHCTLCSRSTLTSRALQATRTCPATTATTTTTRTTSKRCALENSRSIVSPWPVHLDGRQEQ